MAKTKIKKEIKIETKVEDIQQVEEKDFLTQDHLLALETGHRDIETSRLMMAVEEQALRNMVLEHTLLSIKIEKQKEVLKDKSRVYENEKLKFNQVKKEIWNIYGVNENVGLGYDSKTGKIVKN
jgi:flagella basal body P-ring formation protein FlgA